MGRAVEDPVDQVELRREPADKDCCCMPFIIDGEFAGVKKAEEADNGFEGEGDGDGDAFSKLLCSKNALVT
jgi:hypothetical protein